MPPMPVAITTPSRSPSTSGVPASAHASRGATSGNGPVRSWRLISTRGRPSDGSPATGAAMCTGSVSTQSSVSVRTPDLPASRPCQKLGTSPPTGVVAPSPVTTTRWESVWGAFMRSGARLLDVRHGVADRAQALHVVVGDADAELLLGVDDDGHHRQRVDVEVVGERLLGLDVARGDARLLVHDLGETLEDLLLASGHGPLAP